LGASETDETPTTTLDTLTPEQRSERMSRVRSKNTKPEMIVRKITHSLGYRYRLHRKDLPGHPDMVFPSKQKAIFVHGCFWHRHEGCSRCRTPKSKQDFWLPKLEGNRQRDIRSMEQLHALGWTALVIWECEVVVRDIAERDSLTKRITAFLED